MESDKNAQFIRSRGKTGAGRKHAGFSDSGRRVCNIFGGKSPGVDFAKNFVIITCTPPSDFYITLDLGNNVRRGFGKNISLSYGCVRAIKSNDESETVLENVWISNSL